ncbi:unnamed protein product [Amoebophrya sp. A120]|nr:unnamed protein product [Amoebophrya sp. A120]|eukprot:GSA120T00015071001.1
MPRPPKVRPEETKLNELEATSICGNDITASCFYVVGQLCKDSGVYAPLCTVFAATVLFCYRKVYTEVVCALPLNGGLYNVMLNSGFSKRSAAATACLTILSYTATSVVSAVSAMHYSGVADEDWQLAGSLLILVTFALLLLSGMKESARVASVLFVFHLVTMTLLLTACVVTTVQRWEMFFSRDIGHMIAKTAIKTDRKSLFPIWSSTTTQTGSRSDDGNYTGAGTASTSRQLLGTSPPLLLDNRGRSPPVTSSSGALALQLQQQSLFASNAVAFADSDPHLSRVGDEDHGKKTHIPHTHKIFHKNLVWSGQRPPFESVFYGFSTAMLGVSGFESSANFVENQEPGVFPKTLRNMWASVSVLNVACSFFVLCLVPLDELAEGRSDDALAFLAEEVTTDLLGGPWFLQWIRVDAFLVLAASVLTSFVGVTGLLNRMALDRCLPEFFTDTRPFWSEVFASCFCCGWFRSTGASRNSDTDVDDVGPPHAATAMASSREDEAQAAATSGQLGGAGAAGLPPPLESTRTSGRSTSLLIEDHPATEQDGANFYPRQHAIGPAAESTTGNPGTAAAVNTMSKKRRKKTEEAPPWACVVFFLVVCLTLCVALRGDIGLLANMYSMSFLLVMSMFGVGGVVMKYARPSLPRPARYPAHWFVSATLFTLVAFLGALVRNAEVFADFVVFFVFAVSFVMVTYYRVLLLSVFLSFLDRFSSTMIYRAFARLSSWCLGLNQGEATTSPPAGGTGAWMSREEKTSLGRSPHQGPSAKNDVAMKSTPMLAAAVHNQGRGEKPDGGGADSHIVKMNGALVTSPGSSAEGGADATTSNAVHSRRSSHSSTSQTARPRWSAFVLDELRRIRQQGVVFFSKNADIAQLNQVLQYIFQNEDTKRVQIVHCTESGQLPPHLAEYVALLNCIYPDAKIDLCIVNYPFTPAVIPYLEKKLAIPANCMFITCPTANFKHRLATLGGVRVILNDHADDYDLGNAQQFFPAFGGSGSVFSSCSSPAQPSGGSASKTGGPKYQVVQDDEERGP